MVNSWEEWGRYKEDKAKETVGLEEVVPLVPGMKAGEHQGDDEDHQHGGQEVLLGWSGGQAVSDDVGRNSLCFLGFILLHMLVVAIHGVVCSPKFGTSTMRERLRHLVSSFWLPLPFLTIRGVDRGEEKAELCFLIVFHAIENILLLLVSKWANHPGYPLELLLIQISLLIINVVALILSIVKNKKLFFFLALLNIVGVFLLGILSGTVLLPLLAMDLSIVTLNILGVATAYFYTKKFELYADIQHLPDLPSYGPEVRNSMKDDTII